MRNRLALSLAAAVLLSVVASGGSASAAPPAGGALQPLILVMDVSGSMEGERLTQAKQAATTFIENAAIHERVGLFTYPGGREKDGCTPGTFSIPPDGSSTPEDVRVAVGGLAADGDTPTGPALEAIIDHLVDHNVTSGRAVLISDGEANCGNTDICDYADLMAERGVTLEVSTVSFDNTETGNAQLRCLAEQTGGTYTDAKDWAEAERALRDSQSFRADLNVRMPETLTSALVDDDQSVTIDVTPTGRRDIPNAKLILTFTSVGDTPGKPARSVYVERPVRRLGNLAAPPDSGPVVAASQGFSLRPEILQSGELAWTATLLAQNVPIVRVEGTVSAVAHAEAGRMFKDAKRVVILGDSYSSGEGTDNFWDADSPNTQLKLCHRSDFAYGRVLFPDATLIACSGAVSEHLRQPQMRSSTDFVPAQLAQLADDMRRNGPPDLVLFTLGGNDVGFAEQIKACVQLKCTEMREVNWDKLQQSLQDRYAEVNALVNHADAVANRGGKAAQIIVVPYVDPIPYRIDPESYCFALIDHEELRALKPFPALLNATIGRAVDEARQDGAPIQLAETVAGALAPNHTLCTPDPWIYAPYGLLDLAAYSDLDAKNGGGYLQLLMHPTIQGHQAIALDLLVWAARAQPMPLASSPEASSVRYVTPIGSAAFAITSFDALGLPSSTIWPVLEPGRSIQLNVLCSATQHTCDWSKDYPVTVVMESILTGLGTYVPVDGELPPIPIPLDTPPGQHTLTIHGYDQSGQPTLDTLTIQVWPEGVGRALDLAALAASFGLLSSLLFGVSRLRGVGGNPRRRRSSGPRRHRRGRTSLNECEPRLTI